MVTKYQKFGDGYKAEAVKLYRESNQTIAGDGPESRAEGIDPG